MANETVTLSDFPRPLADGLRPSVSGRHQLRGTSQPLRGCDGIFRRHSHAVYSITNPTGCHSCLVAPVNERHRLSVGCDSSRGAIVSVLNIHRCPPAILGAVVAVVVDAIKRVFGTRLPAHVGKEVHESVVAKPAFTNRNSATSVTVILDVLFLQAALLHSVVRVVLRRLMHPMLDAPRTRNSLLSHAAPFENWRINLLIVDAVTKSFVN